MEVQANVEVGPSPFKSPEQQSVHDITGPKKVMVIDDDPDFRQSLKEFLQMHGWEVNEQPHGEAAIRTLKMMSDLPDVILLDYLMPLENGISFWNALNDDRSLCFLPTIMMTGHEMNSINVIGVRAVIKKPIETEGLLKLLNTLINEKRLNLSSHFSAM